MKEGPSACEVPRWRRFNRVDTGAARIRRATDNTAARPNALQPSRDEITPVPNPPEPTIPITWGAWRERLRRLADAGAYWASTSTFGDNPDAASMYVIHRDDPTRPAACSRDRDLTDEDVPYYTLFLGSDTWPNKWVATTHGCVRPEHGAERTSDAAIRKQQTGRVEATS